MSKKTLEKPVEPPSSTSLITLRTLVILVLSNFAAIAGGITTGLAVAEHLGAALSALAGTSAGFVVMIGACVSLNSLIDREH